MIAILTALLLATTGAATCEITQDARVLRSFPATLSSWSLAKRAAL